MLDWFQLKSGNSSNSTNLIQNKIRQCIVGGLTRQNVQGQYYHTSLLENSDNDTALNLIAIQKLRLSDV